MHTAICTFDDRARAEQAVDSLVRAGFTRHDIRIEHEGERDSCVVEVDTRDESEAQRASVVLRELQAGDLKGVAGMVERSREPYENRSSELLVGERAMASDRLDAIEKTALREPEVAHAPGLRYADKDKPNS